MNECIIIGDVSLGTSEEVLVSWWGKELIPKGHILAEKPEVNTVTCHPEEEYTMLTTLHSGWINFLLNLNPKFVADVYSVSGEYKFNLLSV